MSSAAMGSSAAQEGATNKEKRMARKAEKRAAAASEDNNGNGNGEPSKKRKSARVTEVADDAATSSAVGEAGTEEGGGRSEGAEEEDEEVEAVSHKEMRKRRKMEKQAARHAAAEDGKAMDLGSAGAGARGQHALSTAASAEQSEKAKPARSPFSLWIGNLAFNTSSDRIQSWLRDNGIEGISRVHMPKGARKMEYNRGFCYVDVPSLNMVKDGVALSEGHLDGRRLLIKAGSDYTGRPSIDAAARALASGQNVGEADPASAASGDAQGRKGKTGLTKTAQKILRAQRHPPGPTLFFGNLGFSATEEALRDMIERSASSRTEMEDKRAERKHKAKRKEAKEQHIGDDDEEGGEDEGSSDGGEDSEDDREGEDAAQDHAYLGKEGSGKAERSVLRGAGIRKVRLGEFEDTGKCKGFAFVDFHSPAYATATLIDPRNGFLDGRQLIVQYAGAEAIRRGAPKKKGVVVQDAAGAGVRRYTGFRRDRNVEPTTQESLPSAGTVAEPVSAGPRPEPGSFDPNAPLPKKHKETKEERMQRRQERAASSGGRGHERRAKPGAALANAQRGKVSIDLSAPQAVKKTFD